MPTSTFRRAATRSTPELLNIILIVLGVLSANMGLHGFLLSSNFIDGGVTGVSMLVSKVSGTTLSVWAPTGELLGSFTRDRLRVVVGGADDNTGIELAKLPRVRSVEPTERDGELRSYVVTVDPADALAVQRDVTRFAVDHDLTLTENGLVRLDLEDVFLRLVDSKERAA